MKLKCIDGVAGRLTVGKYYNYVNQGGELLVKDDTGKWYYWSNFKFVLTEEEKQEVVYSLDQLLQAANIVMLTVEKYGRDEVETSELFKAAKGLLIDFDRMNKESGQS